MGNQERAVRYSNKFKNQALKGIALYGFDKCGNCVHRLRCGEEILASGKATKHRGSPPIKYIVDSLVAGCPTAKYSSTGFISKELSEFLHSECAKCNKLPICIGYIARHAGYEKDPEKHKVLEEKVNKCLNCKDLDNCINHFMIQLGISKTTLIKQAFLFKFRDCSQKRKMMSSLDIEQELDNTVIGRVAKKEKV